jgi:hypothetical protein
VSGVIETLVAALGALLTTDPVFASELTLATGSGGIGLPSVPANVISNRPFEQIAQLGQENLPCWVIEPIEMQAGPLSGLSDDDYGLTLEAKQQAFKLAIGLGFVWSEQDDAVAYLQRQRLPESLVRLFLRNPDAGVDGCAVCVVTEVQPDQAVNHPMQNLKAVLTADIAIQRS